MRNERNAHDRELETAGFTNRRQAQWIARFMKSDQLDDCLSDLPDEDPQWPVTALASLPATGKPGLDVSYRLLDEGQIIARTEEAQVIYRDPAGKPVGVAHLFREVSKNGRPLREGWHCNAFAVDRSQGILAARAAKAVLEQCWAMGMYTTDVISPDFGRMIFRFCRDKMRKLSPELRRILRTEDT